MTDTPFRPLSVPAHRAARLARLGGLAGGLLADTLRGGLRQAVRGERPRLADLLTSAEVATRLARDLGRMRGAAMKLGQMLSMDEGVILPPEMTAILARLRAEAPPMPPRQLDEVLGREWGPDWRARVARFDLQPFAAASIGQVHRAWTQDGRALAVKVQYPGVRDSIDSDIDNLGTLLRLPGLLPRGLDLAPLLAEARRQLRAEADYRAEAGHLSAFRRLLEGHPAFALPEPLPELSTDRVLAMTFLPGQPLETLASAPQALRDRLASDLIGLVLAELFDFGLMQSDPNLGNYRFDPTTGRIVLLDFGAALPIAPGMTADFRALLAAGLSDRPAEIEAAMAQVGYLSPTVAAAHRATIVALFRLAMAPLRQAGPFDFGRSTLALQLAERGRALGQERDLTHVPPPATLFLHRKIGGIYLLAARLGARVALRPLVERHLAPGERP